MGSGGRVHHVELKGVVESRVHEFHRHAHRERRCGSDAARDFPQPAEDLRAVVGERVPGERGREVLLDEQRRRAPGLREPCGRMTILGFAERLVQSRQVVLHRRHDEQIAGARQVPTDPHQGEVLVEGAVPAASLPRHRPARPAVGGGTGLHPHPGLVDRPGGHRLRARFIFRDDRLEHHERQSRGGVLLQLARVERQLPRAFADGMGEGLSQVASGEIDPIRRPHVRGEVARQLPLEPLEVLLEPGAHPTASSVTAGIARRALHP